MSGATELSPPPHLLVVDDDDRLRALLSRYLRGQGFAVSTAVDAREARTLLDFFLFDLMVLDVMMPGESGIELADSLRTENKGDVPPILMLSAATSPEDRVGGFRAGVDDYLTKPFEPQELTLRLQAILRRTARKAPPAERHTVVFGEYRFDTESGELLQKSEPVRLTGAESAMMRAFSARLGEPVTREELARLAGLSSESERGVDVAVTRLRRKIESGVGETAHLRTVRGAGYALYGRYEEGAG